MEIKTPFIQASQCLTGVESYICYFRDKKVREICRRDFASLLTARHIGEEFFLKDIFCKH